MTLFYGEWVVPKHWTFPTLHVLTRVKNKRFLWYLYFLWMPHSDIIGCKYTLIIIYFLFWARFSVTFPFLLYYYSLYQHFMGRKDTIHIHVSVCKYVQIFIRLATRKIVVRSSASNQQILLCLGIKLNIQFQM